LINIDALQKKWVHSHEEDTADAMVFRPADYEFGLSRGRKALEFLNDGTVYTTGPSPNDKLVFSDGTWKLLDDGNTIEIEGGEPTNAKLLNILSLDDQKLVISK
jgi:hypothetical protein